MDLNDFWQENKRLIVVFGCGLLVFLIAQMVVEGSYGSDLASARRDRETFRSKLREARYAASERDEAAEENDALHRALATLAAAAAFEPREGFVVADAGASASGLYFARVEEVREDLGLLASRNRMAYPDGWGIEMLETNSAPVVERHLEALDLIDRVARLAMEAGVQRVSKVVVRLDSGFGSRQGLGRVERTRVVFTLKTSAASLTRLLALSQGTRYGRPLCLETYDVKSERNKPESVSAELTFLIVRLRDLPLAEGEEDVEG